MITICFADNSPIVHQGMKTFFSESKTCKVETFVKNYDELQKALSKGKFNTVILDVELNGLNSIINVKALVKNNPETNFIIFTNVSDTLYAPPAIKSGVKAYLSKNIELAELEKAIVSVNKGEVIFSESVREAIEMLKKVKKEDRLYKKLSSREIEVLRYFNEGKKNKEVAKILALDEKTISTYKLRLLQKLNVTNLVDLLNKSRELEIIS